MGLDARCGTNRYFQVIGSIHDISSYFRIDNEISLSVSIFLSHWAHLSIIFMWLAGNIFHIGWIGNYELWKQNPIKTIPIAHSIFDPHFGSSEIENNVAYSGLYNILMTIGFSSNYELYNFLILAEYLAMVSILLAFIHLIYLDSYLQWLVSGNYLSLSFGSTQISQSEIEFKLNLISLSKKLGVNGLKYSPFRLFITCFDLSGERLNFHIGILFGVTSIGWAGHIIHQALPISRGVNSGWNSIIGSRIIFGQDMDKDNHVWRSTYGAGNIILTFFGGLKSNTMSLYLSDISHHHLALGVLLIFSSHLYRSLYKGFGHRIRDILNSNGNSTNLIALCHKSLHLSLSLALFALSLITSMIAQHIYALLPYVYLSYVTSVALYCHHQYIASLLMIGALSHLAIFLIRDYIRSHNIQSVIDVILQTKGQLVSHLSWVSSYLGFHTLGIWIHNDTVVAFGDSEKQILIEAIFAINFQRVSTLASLLLGPGDLFVHHAIAFGVHLCVLILLKGALDGRGSKLMPDKINFSLSFACDGPSRGGTCDISAWDAIYLTGFWMLNTDAWMMFYFHWKNLCIFLCL